jgi:CRP-like cAMP-binding protein
MVQYSLMQQNRMLAALPPGECDRLERHLIPVAPDQGTVLQEVYAPIDYVYFPVRGLLSLVVRMNEGDAVETGIVGNEVGVSRAFTTTTVQVPGQFLRASAAEFAAAFRECPTLCTLVERYHAALFFQAKQLIACNALHGAEARLARWVLQVRDRIEASRLPLTHEFLAQMLAVRRTTVTEVLGVFQERGLVRQHRGAIELLDQRRLQDIACECYEVIREQQGHVLPDAPAPA